jgi:hypothetical protein
MARPSLIGSSKRYTRRPLSPTTAPNNPSDRFGALAPDQAASDFAIVIQEFLLEPE